MHTSYCFHQTQMQNNNGRIHMYIIGDDFSETSDWRFKYHEPDRVKYLYLIGAQQMVNFLTLIHKITDNIKIARATTTLLQRLISCSFFFKTFFT